MIAAHAFLNDIEDVASQVESIEVTLHGSLAYTGKGHGTDSAIVLGLLGLVPETIDPEAVEGLLRAVHAEKKLNVPLVGEIDFDPDVNVVFDYGDELPRHTNGMRFVARSASQDVLADEKYYSLGGGFIAHDDDPEPTAQPPGHGRVLGGAEAVGGMQERGRSFAPEVEKRQSAPGFRTRHRDPLCVESGGHGGTG